LARTSVPDGAADDLNGVADGEGLAEAGHALRGAVLHAARRNGVRGSDDTVVRLRHARRLAVAVRSCSRRRSVARLASRDHHAVRRNKLRHLRRE
jgi:hypothetical protein